MYIEIKKSINQALREYFNDCPLIEEADGQNYVSIEYLGKDLSFSISALPVMNNGLYTQDILGNKTYRYGFQFSAKFEYSPDVMLMIENSTFFENLKNWIEYKNSKKEYPELSIEDNRYSTNMRITQSPMILAIDDNNALSQYVINFELEYIERNLKYAV
jgi:hypothetical protein